MKKRGIAFAAVALLSAYCSASFAPNANACVDKNHRTETRSTQGNQAYYSDRQQYQRSYPFNSAANNFQFSRPVPRTMVARWSPQKLPLAVYIDSGRGIDGFRPVFPELAMEALNEWSDASNGKLQFQLVSNPNHADITLAWSDTVSGNQEVFEAGNTITTTSYNGRTGDVSISHAHINLLTQVGGNSFSDIEIKKVALHEIGHAIGIQGHSPNPADIMYAVTSRAQQPQLSPQDISAINQIYSSNSVANLNQQYGGMRRN
ncbi:MAG: matrixin family metalloprotease [Leptolyngbya sp.]|nr:matrixin family metalloprotease [Candidatus Melainabacteria bacterium]